MINKLKSYISNVSYYWKVAALLALGTAIIPTLILIYMHQGRLARAGVLAVVFPIAVKWIIKKFHVFSTIKVDWKLLWLVFVVGYSVIVMLQLVGTGIPKYKDERSFYSQKNKIERQIKSGNLDAVRDLGFLYLEKSIPIPYPYNDQSIHKKGENILDKWFTGKINDGTAKDYTKDMIRFANTIFPQSKALASAIGGGLVVSGGDALTIMNPQDKAAFSLAKKWLGTASNYGSKSALVWLKALEKEAADIKRMELHQKIIQEQIREQKIKERENSHPIKSLGRFLGQIKQAASNTITNTTAPMKKKWQEFQEGISEGESKSGH